MIPEQREGQIRGTLLSKVSVMGAFKNTIFIFKPF